MMREEFLSGTKMIDANGEKEGVNEIAEYLFSPENIYKLKLASDMGWPVLTLIAKDLENNFGEQSKFPLVVTDKSKNAVYRQNVGRIVKFIMNKLGYVPVDGGISERTRIPAISKANYFTTSAIYEKRHDAKYSLSVGLANISE